MAISVDVGNQFVKNSRCPKCEKLSSIKTIRAKGSKKIVAQLCISPGCKWELSIPEDKSA